MRAVLFDVDGVLVHGYHARAEKQRRWDEHLLIDLGIEPEAFKKEFIHGIFESQVIVGKLSLVNALEQTLPKLGYSGSPMTVISYWLERDSQINYQLIDVVRSLQRKRVAKLYIATNQEHLRAFHLWNALGFRTLFDDMFNSARLGAMKPGREFFERASELLGNQAEPPLMFDDSPAVVTAANDFGWEGVLYDDVRDCSNHPWVSQHFG